MIKRTLFLAMLTTLITACSSQQSNWPVNPEREVASFGSREGTYLTKEIRNEDGQIGVLREFELLRNYAGKNLKGIVVEAYPYSNYNRRTRVDIIANNQPIESHDVQVRQGRQHLYTDIDLELRDELRQLSVQYNPREVSIRSITVLINDDRPWDNMPGPGPVPGPGGMDTYKQDFPRISRARGGANYDVMIPQHIDARFVLLEAVNAPVAIYNLMTRSQQVQLPGGFGSRLYPGQPIQIALPQGGWERIDSLRITAEGMQSDLVGLRVTVSNRPIMGGNPGPIPGPGPGPGPFPQPVPPRVVTESCSVTRYDPAGFVVQTHNATATGPVHTDVRGQACDRAMMDCRRNLKGRQSCR